MPFPLAHPAAVLPLRRYCPRFFSFPALVVGSIVPDVAYFFGKSNVDRFSHGLLGSIGFCLPVGLSFLGVFYLFRALVTAKLPERYQRVFRPLCAVPVGSFKKNVFSLWIGCLTHLAWDSFTHKDGWVVTHMAFLQYPIGMLGGRNVRVCHVLWYVCSFVGIDCFFFSYIRWQKRASGAVSRESDRADLWFASLVALFLLPIELVHHLLTGSLGLVLAGAFTLFLMLIVLRRIGSELSPDRSEQISCIESFKDSGT